MPRYGTTPSERATMARALATLFAAGATLVLLTLALPHAADTRDAMLALAAGLAYVVAALLGGLSERFSVLALQLVLAGGTLLISVCVAYGGGGAAAYPLMYLWVSLFASFFFRPVAAMLEVGLIGVAYAVALAAQEHPTPVPGIHWLMTIGAVGVGAVLLGRLAGAIRAQAADATAVARMSGGLRDAPEFGHELCAALQRSTRADVVALLEPGEDGAGLGVAAMSGVGEAGLVLQGARARGALAEALRTGEAAELRTDGPATLRRRLLGDAVGWAQPVLRHGGPAAVLAVGWTTPRRTIAERVRSAAQLYAAEATVAMDRAERRRRDRERRALEINDNIVQGLVVAKYAAQAGAVAQALRAIDETLARARALMGEQLAWVGEREGAIRPGDLARGEASFAAPPAVGDAPA